MTHTPRFVITDTSPTSGTIYCRTKRGMWCFYLPGMNDYLFQTFDSKEEAIKEIQSLQKGGVSDGSKMIVREL